MHGGVRALIPVIFVAAVVASSGCLSIDPEAFARTMPMVKEFLEEHPNAELHIVHYSASEAEGILDQIKEDCGKTTIEAKEYYFVNLTDPDTDLMIRAWIDWETQTVECIYKAGGAIKERECQSHYEAICFNEHVFWVDACGNREEKKEYCPLRCREGRCISDPDKICDPEKTYEDKPDCVCPEGYEMLVIYPRCLKEAVQIGTTQQVADLVTGGITAVEPQPDYTTAISERCIDGRPLYRCVKREMCRSRAEFRCYNGHVYWFDSCGHRQEKKEYCEHGCGLGFCNEKNICELGGGYCVYPVACTKDAKICPDGTAVGRIPPTCEFAICPSESAAGSGGGGSLEAMWQTGYFVPATTGMTIQRQSIPVTETITQTEIYPVPAEDIITGYNQCRPGYVPSGLYCPKNGLCCLPVENRERCFDYTVNDVAVKVCATCGNGVCERFETCTSTFCNAAGACTDDCGPLYCPEDCKPVCPDDCPVLIPPQPGLVCKPIFDRCGCITGYHCEEHKCWDSDGGKNYHVKGVVETEDTRLEDHCNEDGTLTEKYCTENGEAAAVTVECPEGTVCGNGACSRECANEGSMCGGIAGIMCCDGLKCALEGNYPDASGVCVKECAREGGYTSGAVSPEYYYGCCKGLEGFDPHPPEWVGGGLLCYNPEKGTPVCEGVGTDDEGWYYPTGELLRHEKCSETTAFCEDSDEGKNKYFKGVTNNGTHYAEDSCIFDEETQTYSVNEWFCEGNNVKYESILCLGDCENGACKLSDLIIENISLEYQPTQVANLPSYVYTIIVKNIGEAPAEDSRLKVEISPNQVQRINQGTDYISDYKGSTSSVPNKFGHEYLQPGETSIYSDYFNPIYNGSVEIAAMTDVFNEVVESNENNNVMSKTFSVNQIFEI